MMAVLADLMGPKPGSQSVVNSRNLCGSSGAADYINIGGAEICLLYSAVEGVQDALELFTRKSFELGTCDSLFNFDLRVGKTKQGLLQIQKLPLGTLDFLKNRKPKLVFQKAEELVHFSSTPPA